MLVFDIPRLVRMAGYRAADGHGQEDTGAARALERVLWGRDTRLACFWSISPKLSSLITRSSISPAVGTASMAANSCHMMFCCVAQHVLDQQFAQLHHADGMRTSGADAKQHQNVDDLTLDEMLEAKRGSMLEQTSWRQ